MTETAAIQGTAQETLPQAQQDNIPATIERPTEPKPQIGRAVLVSFHDPSHVVITTVAHVLAIGPADENGMPTISVAFPNPAADPIKLASPRWQDGYQRQAGVVHHLHPAAKAGKVSIVWGHAISGDDAFPALLAKPEGDGKNPIFEREIFENAPKPNVAQVSAMQHGKAPEGSSAPALTSEVGSPAPVGETAPAAPQEPATGTQETEPEK